jgi:MinD-like ATPase involved in chromosome partitioning or flagellar assembly
MRKAVGASATTGERDRSELTAQLGGPVRSCRRIAVMSIRDGAGKSSIAALLAGTIQGHRDDRVLAIDADPGLGALPLRLGVAENTNSLHDVVAARPRSWAEASPFLARTETGVWVVEGTSHDEYRSGAGLLSRYFSVSVIDCGAGMETPLHKSVLRSAHAQVFVVPGTQDAAAGAQPALHWLQENGHDPVVAVVAHTPDVERARDVLGTDTVIVPFDRHLSAGTTISPERVGAATHTAIARIAAQSFGRAQREGTQ